MQAARLKQTTLFKPQPLTVEGVLRTFRQIAAETGHAVRFLPVILLSSITISLSMFCGIVPI